MIPCLEFRARRLRGWEPRLSESVLLATTFRSYKLWLQGLQYSPLGMLSPCGCPSVWAGEGQSCLAEMERAPPKLEMHFHAHPAPVLLPALSSGLQSPPLPTHATEGAWSPGEGGRVLIEPRHLNAPTSAPQPSWASDALQSQRLTRHPRLFLLPASENRVQHL